MGNEPNSSNGQNDENVDLAIKLHADMMVDAIIPDEELGPQFNPQDTEIPEKR